MGAREALAGRKCWRRQCLSSGSTGFADTTLQELEQATGVNKSGLYTEFRGKEDLFVACLRHYLERQGKRGLLTKEPLGWKNVERFLQHGPLNKGEQQVCFAINSMREVAILPDEAYGAITENRVLLQHLLAMNIEAEKPRMTSSAIAGMVLSSPEPSFQQCSNQHRNVSSKING
jgi:AcrR family transcriptional regulator